LEYAGLLTKIDWKFMVMDVTKGPSSEPENIPETGDTMDRTQQYVIFMIIAGICLAGCFIILASTNKKRETEEQSNKQY